MEAMESEIEYSCRKVTSWLQTVDFSEFSSVPENELLQTSEDEEDEVSWDRSESGPIVGKRSKSLNDSKVHSSKSKVYYQSHFENVPISKFQDVEKKGSKLSFSDWLKQSSEKNRRVDTSCGTSAVPSFKSHKTFTSIESEAIMKYIIENNGMKYVKGNLIWKKMEVDRICERSWPSMRNHFLRSLSQRHDSKFSKSNRQYQLEKIPEPSPSKEKSSLLQPGERGWRRNAKYYTLREDQLMIQFILRRNRHTLCSGNSLWKDMEERNVVEERSWQSMRTRFLRHVLKNLWNYDLTEKEHEVLRSIRAKPSVVSESVTKKPYSAQPRNNESLERRKRQLRIEAARTAECLARNMATEVASSDVNMKAPNKILCNEYTRRHGTHEETSPTVDRESCELNPRFDRTIEKRNILVYSPTRSRFKSCDSGFASPVNRQKEKVVDLQKCDPNHETEHEVWRKSTISPVPERQGTKRKRSLSRTSGLSGRTHQMEATSRDDSEKLQYSKPLKNVADPCDEEEQIAYRTSPERVLHVSSRKSDFLHIDGTRKEKVSECSQEDIDELEKHNSPIHMTKGNYGEDDFVYHDGMNKEKLSDTCEDTDGDSVSNRSCYEKTHPIADESKKQRFSVLSKNISDPFDEIDQLENSASPTLGSKRNSGVNNRVYHNATRKEILSESCEDSHGDSVRNLEEVHSISGEMKKQQNATLSKNISDPCDEIDQLEGCSPPRHVLHNSLWDCNFKRNDGTREEKMSDQVDHSDGDSVKNRSCDEGTHTITDESKRRHISALCKNISDSFDEIDQLENSASPTLGSKRNCGEDYLIYNDGIPKEEICDSCEDSDADSVRNRRCYEKIHSIANEIKMEQVSALSKHISDRCDENDRLKNVTSLTHVPNDICGDDNFVRNCGTTKEKSYDYFGDSDDGCVRTGRLFHLNPRKHRPSWEASYVDLINGGKHSHGDAWELRTTPENNDKFVDAARNQRDSALEISNASDIDNKSLECTQHIISSEIVHSQFEDHGQNRSKHLRSIPEDLSQLTQDTGDENLTPVLTVKTCDGYPNAPLICPHNTTNSQDLKISHYSLARGNIGLPNCTPPSYANPVYPPNHNDMDLLCDEKCSNIDCGSLSDSSLSLYHTPPEYPESRYEPRSKEQTNTSTVTLCNEFAKTSNDQNSSSEAHFAERGWVMSYERKSLTSTPQKHHENITKDMNLLAISPIGKSPREEELGGVCTSSNSPGRCSERCSQETDNSKISMPPREHLQYHLDVLMNVDTDYSDEELIDKNCAIAKCGSCCCPSNLSPSSN